MFPARWRNPPWRNIELKRPNDAHRQAPRPQLARVEEPRGDEAEGPARALRLRSRRGAGGRRRAMQAAMRAPLTSGTVRVGIVSRRGIKAPG